MASLAGPTTWVGHFDDTTAQTGSRQLGWRLLRPEWSPHQGVSKWLMPWKVSRSRHGELVRRSETKKTRSTRYGAHQRMQCKSADTQRFGCDIKHCVESNRVSSMILVRFWNHFPRCKVIKVGIGRIPYQQQEFRRFNETSARRRQWLPENQNNNNVQSEEHLLRHLRESKQHRGIKRDHITKAVSLANHRAVRTGGRQKPTHPLD